MTAGADALRPARIRLPVAPIAAFVLLVIGTLSLAPAVSTSMAQQRRIDDAEARIAAQEADLQDLAAQRARWDDPAYVRAQAGRRLFYVLPGTTAYRVLHSSASASATAAPAPAPTAQAVTAPWTTVLLDSLVDAGRTTSTPAELEPGR